MLNAAVAFVQERRTRGRILNRRVLYVLTQAGWHSGDPTGAHTRFHHAYQQATTMTFLGVIFGQIGTAFAVRTRRASLRSVGVFSNRYLLWAIAGELAIAAVFVFVPPCQALLGTAVPPARDMLLLIPFPFIVWGADELRKWVIRSPVLAARAGRHTSTRRLTFGRTSNEYGSRKAPSDSVASTRWPLAAVAGVLRGAWQSATSSVGGATH